MGADIHVGFATLPQRLKTRPHRPVAAVTSGCEGRGAGTVGGVWLADLGHVINHSEGVVLRRRERGQRKNGWG